MDVINIFIDIFMDFAEEAVKYVCVECRIAFLKVIFTFVLNIWHISFF